MKYLIFAIALSACSAPPIDRCDAPLTGCADRAECRCDKGRDDKAPVKAVKPTPQPTPRPEPTPEPEKHPVCDGGARGCRDGETPTGWE